MRICVFCGSSAGRGESYLAAATTLGRLLAEAGIGLVYGGARVGTMGAVADAALAAGGEVTGVIPTGLADRELAHTGLTDLRVVADMHERKATMARLSDAFLALPGGAGTLEELFEVWTWAQIGLHGKPIGLVDVGGYYQPLLRFVEHMVTEGFLRPGHAELVAVDADPAVLVSGFAERIRSAPDRAVAAPPAGVQPDVAEPSPAEPDAAGSGAAEPVDVLSWVHVRDGRLLTVRTRGKQPFYLPGGKREPGESDPAALLREIREELGIALDPASLRCVDVLTDAADGFAGGREVRMICYRAEHTGEPAPGAEIAELLWAAPEDAGRLAPAARRVLRSLTR